MIVINDVHIGAIRAGGTTTTTALQLREYLLAGLQAMLDNVKEPLVILGDLFDAHSIPMQDLLQTYQMLSAWLKSNGEPLWLVAGNHDLSKDSSKLSSFQFLAKLLEPQGATYVEGGQFLTDDVYAISHVANQDLYDMELDKVPECEYLLVHANYNNDFAAESDHSLNLSRERAEALPVAKIFFAHEHYYRKLLGGKVFVAGNQLPSSISDCLKQVDKYMHRLPLGGDIERIKTWDNAEYLEMDWKNPVDTDAKFIRFVGSASEEEAAEHIEVIANYRRTSSALIVGNGVKILNSGRQADVELDSFEAVKSFDVMSALEGYLSESDMSKIRNLK